MELPILPKSAWALEGRVSAVNFQESSEWVKVTCSRSYNSHSFVKQMRIETVWSAVFVLVEEQD